MASARDSVINMIAVLRWRAALASPDPVYRLG